MFTILVISLKPCKCFGLCEAIDGIRCKYLAPEDFVTLGIFFRLSSFKHTILVGPGKNYFTAFTNKSAVFICKPNLVLIRGIAISQE